MRLVDRTDIEGWSDRFDSKSNLPVLISRLVKSTTPPSTTADFPAGTAANVGGWDGVVVCSENRAYVPEGVSLWEFGTEKDVKGKIDDDYEKRTANPLGFNPAESTFVFVTTRFWKNKDAWVKEKLEEKKWKDIKVYDSVGLEQWLDDAPAVSRLFAGYIGKVPNDGIVTIEQYWDEYSLGPQGRLDPRTITAGREFELDQLQAFLSNPEGIKGVKASTKDEAIAFIIAAAMQFKDANRQLFFSKSLVIESANSFRVIQSNRDKLNLISNFEQQSILYAAVSKGHHVLVPLGPDDTLSSETITLPSIDRDGQIEALVSMGLTPDDARKYSMEAARNITILKRLLKFPQGKWDVHKLENVHEIIPALLLGRWDEGSKGDIDLLEFLSGEKYEKYIQTIAKWKDFDMVPFLQIGTSWRLASPLDAWTNLAPYITKDDITQLGQAVLKAFQNGNPVIQQESKFYFLGGTKTYSSWSREGLLQSLILIATYGERLKIANSSASQSWVDGLIKNLLKDANGELWVSLNHEMPLVAEASPLSFTEAVNISLNTDKSILEMFAEKEEFFSSGSSHTGLLWALEGLAWLPEYLYSATLILSKLARLDPGGNLYNRPINSLKEIFKSWHYQTLAPFGERIEILKKLAEQEKDIIWKVLLSLLPEHHGIGHPTHKMRWRMFEKSFNLHYTNKEVGDTINEVVNILISIFDDSEEKLSDIIDVSVRLYPEQRSIIFDFVETRIPKIEQKTYVAWHELRKTLSHHRSFPNEEWTLPKDELDRLEKWYFQLEPKDDVDKYLWLFNEHFPFLPEGFVQNDDIPIERQKKRQESIDKLREQGIRKIIESTGLENAIELSQKVKLPTFYGDTLATVIKNDDEIKKVIDSVNKTEENLLFVQSFIWKNSVEKGLNWGLELFEELQVKGFSNKALGKYLVALPQSKTLWEFVSHKAREIQEEYWSSINLDYYRLGKEERIIGVNSLRRYGRFFSAIHIASVFLEELSSEFLAELLVDSVTKEANEDVSIQGYEVGRILEEIDKRNDLPKDKLITLEWLFLPVLTSYSTSRQPKYLVDELANNPEFFIDVLKFLYLPNDKKKIDDERRGLTDAQIESRGKNAWELLHNWKKVPGTLGDGTLDATVLEKWVFDVRKLAQNVDRLEVADMEIGRILAQFPEKDDSYPPDAIADIIESLNSDNINRHYSSALFNKRGSSSRGPFDGGNIERGHAEFFQKLANKHKDKHPILSGIFSDLSRGYLRDAKRMDENAERDKLEY